MREISPSYFHKPGHVRTPGPDPTPTKRRSTQPQEVIPVSPLPQPVLRSVTPAPAVKPRKGKACGSKKPHYVLTKALIKKALAEGYYELLDEREEHLAEQQAISEAKPRTLEEILAEQKVRRLLASMKEVRIVINVGALVQAAKQDPKLYKMLQETEVPSKKSAPLKAKTDRKGIAAKATRPSFGTSHRSPLGSKSKGGMITSTMTSRKRAGDKKRKFH